MHDRLCTVSAVGVGGYPRRLFPSQEIEKTMIVTICREVMEGGVLQDPGEVEHRISQALSLLASELTKPPIIDGVESDVALSDWNPYFDYAYAICNYQDLEEPISGYQVQRRLVWNSGEHNDFFEVVTEAETGSMKSEATSCANPYFFVLLGPYHYLEAWLAKDLLSQAAGHSPMPFWGELYEIVNYREGRLHEDTGLLDCISYGGLEETCSDATGWIQFDFAEARKGSFHTIRAIRMNSSDEALKSAIARDFCCWQTKRPDNWPSRDEYTTPPFTIFPSTGDESIFDLLSTELLLEILGDLPLPSLLSFAAASKGTRNLFSNIADALVSSMYPRSLLWALPVAAIKGELGRAEKAIRTWHPSPLGHDTSALHSNQFPHFDFLRACHAEEQDSMRNRRRLWHIAKQFDKLWYQYRTSDHSRR